MEELFCATFFFSLVSVSFYCKGCAGNFFLKSSTLPPQKKSQMVRPLVHLKFVALRDIAAREIKINEELDVCHKLHVHVWLFFVKQTV